MNNDTKKNNGQSTDIERLKKFLIDEKRKIARGSRGKFVSLKKLEEKKELPVTSAQKVTFFGKEIRKYYIGDKVFFAVDDILATATPLTGKEMLEYTEDFEKIKELTTKKVGEVLVADADGILRLIKEVVAAFPGPLSRWLKE
jgi:hypothetical protein